MHYLTRHLEALTDISVKDRLVRSGERFEASEIDADYYIAKKKAIKCPQQENALDEVAPPPASESQAESAPPVRRTYTRRAPASKE